MALNLEDTMDRFGIDNAMIGIAEVFFMASRQTGRTTALLDSLKSGDRVVFSNIGAMRDFERRARERDIKVDVVLIPAQEPYRVLDKRASQGHTVFDHRFIEDYYLDAIKKAGFELKKIAEMASCEPPATVTEFAEKTRSRMRKLS